jgi:predicted ATPase/class 3 adenylate cyclase
MEKLPDGVVTFLFTDVEGSTRLWEEAPDSMMEALRLHDGVIATAVEAHNGVVVKPRGEGDSQFVVFASAIDAVEGSAEMQRRLAEVDWPTPRPLRVRASLHTGMAELERGDYYGLAVNRTARLRAIAHGGQSIMSASTFELVQDYLPDWVTVTDMGAQRLKDLTRPEHVFQLNVEGLIDAFPALKSLDSVANNLPEQLTELIGRETELAETERLLGETRLLTILAPGGTGKTRLAVQAAADLIADYPDGVFFIALADISSSGDISQTVAEAVGVALSSTEDSQAQLLEYLAPRRQLLVFDNFEHLTDEALIVSAILKAAPNITVISTSRAKLGLTGEAVMSLGGLNTTWDSPEEALKTSGVRLFLDAARRTRTGISLGADDIEPLAEILRLTAGMPLGILLAAAWVDVLSIPDIAAEIAKSLDFLETTVADAPERHRSIRAVFAYTWQLLSPDEQDTFAGLSVFRGGFTREAAEAVAGASLRDLANLASKSLVTPNPDTGRYSVHELLRQYAEAELADQPERHGEINQAHADYYADLTQQGFGMFALGDQNRMLAAIESDLENVRPAWRYHLATNNAAGVRKMVRGLWIVYEIRGWYQAFLALFDEASEAFEQGRDDAAVVAQAHILAIRGATLALMGRSEAGLAKVRKGVALMRESGDPEELFFALQLEAQTVLYLGRFDEAAASVDEAIALSEKPDSHWTDRRFWAAGFKNLGAFVALATGDTHRAAMLLDESREVLEPIEELYYMSWNLGHRARLALGEGLLEDAIDLFSQSAERARQLGFLRGLQVSLAALGEVSLTTGDQVTAQAAFIESLDAAERMSMVPEMLGALVSVGRVSAANGRYKEAVELLATVIAEPTSNRQLFTESTSINAMASVELEKLQDVVDTSEYERAQAAGSSKDYRVVAKQLIDTIS